MQLNRTPAPDPPMLTKSELDPTELLAVARRATGDPTFELLDWDLHILSNGGSVNPDGLLRVDGHGCGAAGILPWTVALKVINLAPPEVPPTDMGYFQRESIAYAAGALAALPGPIRAAHCYGAAEENGRARIWLELLAGRSGRDWDLADYAFAADQLGRFHAACTATNPLAGVHWVGRNLARSWQSILPFDAAWADPHVRTVFPPTLQRRLEHFWAEHARFLEASERLPQVFSHNDYKSRNLFIRPNAQGAAEIAAVDWGNCGLGPLGGDLAMLVSGTVFVVDWDPARASTLSAAAWEAYAGALAAAGLGAKVPQARLGYLLWSALFYGPPLAGIVALVMQDENRDFVERVFGCSPTTYGEALATLADFTLDCADEVRGMLPE